MSKWSDVREKEVSNRKECQETRAAKKFMFWKTLSGKRVLLVFKAIMKRGKIHDVKDAY